MWTLDFETKKIVDGSGTTPEPVGVSLKYNNEPSFYMAWGHPSGNNTKKAIAKEALQDAMHSGEIVLCHNSKFDLRVAYEHFDIPLPKSDLVRDTMIMAYLIDPREPSLALKDLAKKYCGMAPDDQSALHAWIVAHIPNSKSDPGAYISMAPGELVGRYAQSDTDMTYALYHTLAHRIYDQKPIHNRHNITDAAFRESRLFPVVIDLERRGINISDDVNNIRTNLEAKFDLLNLQLSAYSGGAKPGSKAMFDSFRRKDLIDESKLEYTEKKNPRYGAEFLPKIINDRELVNILLIRSKLQKLLGTYVRPFSESYNKNGGKFYPYYNQTRSEDDYGTRTGRFSSNIQQLPKDSGANSVLFAEDDITMNELPSVRSLIVAGPGKILLKRDFSGQELRVTAHYAEGNILKAYLENPRLDVHSWVDQMIQAKTGMKLARTPIKMISFLKLYGGGPKMLAQRLGIPISQAYEFFQAYDSAIPEFKSLMGYIERQARSGAPIRTWGGRPYMVEEPRVVNGMKRDNYYKLGNVLIQGSSADMTKTAMIRYFEHPDRRGNLVMTVHDELVAEVDERYLDDEMQILRWSMDDIDGWDVPLRSDGAYGVNLGNMEKYKDEDQ